MIMLQSRRALQFQTIWSPFRSFSFSPRRGFGSEVKRVRVRFAPSPTGFLHLGGFRTALLNALFSLKFGGRFILRIEDTDRTRLVPGAVQALQDDLTWLGIRIDEGPFLQSERLASYHQAVERLLEKGAAYECFCSETRLDLIRKEALRTRQVPRYDNKCRGLRKEEVVAKKAKGEGFCVRFKLQPEEVELQDLVHGKVRFDLTERNYEGDPVIIKADGFPTYHFANVVDDHEMEISHVLRGVEWQVSTPKHLQLYRAFGWDPPKFGHLPNVVNKDGTKLSKRQGDVSVKFYREEGYYPQALANFVTKSGGGFSDHSVDKVFSNEELAEMFDVSQVNTAACRLDFELLKKLNQVELENKIKTDFTSVLGTLKDLLLQRRDVTEHSSEYLEKVLRWCPPRVNRLNDLLSPEMTYLWTVPIPSMKMSHSYEELERFLKEFEKILRNSNSGAPSENLTTFIKNYATENSLKFKLLMKDVRLLFCGSEKGPPIADLIALFGTEFSIKRLHQGLQAVFNNSPDSSQISQICRLRK